MSCPTTPSLSQWGLTFEEVGLRLTGELKLQLTEQHTIYNFCLDTVCCGAAVTVVVGQQDGCSFAGLEGVIFMPSANP